MTVEQLTTLLDELRQISSLIEGTASLTTAEGRVRARGAKTRLDKLRVRLSKDLRQVQEAEQYDETPSRESVHP